MALQQSVKLSLPLVPLLPGIALLPLGLVLFKDLHGGGWTLLWSALRAVVTPNLNPVVVSSFVEGAQITLVTAVLAWAMSCLAGTIVGIVCSDTFWTLVGAPFRVGTLVRLPLALIRSIHELIWGLILLQLLGLSFWVASLAIAIPYTAYMARLVRDLIDTGPSPPWRALIGTGASAMSSLLTALAPSIGPQLIQQMGQRLDCALRAAVMLGVFGLGGLGTALMLSLQSLRFREVSSGLWILALLMVLVETSTRAMRCRPRWLPALLLVAVPICVLWASQLNLDLSWPTWTPLPIRPTIHSVLASAAEGHWVRSVGATLVITFWASALAIALPPILLLLWPSQIAQHLQRFSWRLCRICPVPLAALMLLLLVKPSLAVAAAALGLHHAGVTGRILLDAVEQCQGQTTTALQAMGSGSRSTVLYGPLSTLSRNYLAVGAQRSEVILRDTAVVGLVGGAGLGWDLMEALSSFHWDFVIALLMAYAVLTYGGEVVTERWQRIWACQADLSPH